MSDLISRQAAIDAFYKHPNINWTTLDVLAKIDALPSAQPDLSGYSDKLWKAAYERGKAEAWQRWIPCSEMLPEPRKAVLGYAPRYQNIYALYYDSAYGWMIWNPLRDDCFPNSQGEIVAWMPLPEAYREGDC
jgi:hypothetical protein